MGADHPKMKGFQCLLLLVGSLLVSCKDIARAPCDDAASCTSRSLENLDDAEGNSVTITTNLKYQAEFSSGDTCSQFEHYEYVIQYGENGSFTISTKGELINNFTSSGQEFSQKTTTSQKTNADAGEVGTVLKGEGEGSLAMLYANGSYQEVAKVSTSSSGSSVVLEDNVIRSVADYSVLIHIPNFPFETKIIQEVLRKEKDDYYVFKIKQLLLMGPAEPSTGSKNDFVIQQICDIEMEVPMKGGSLEGQGTGIQIAKEGDVTFKLKFEGDVKVSSGSDLDLKWIEPLLLQALRSMI